MKIEKLHLSSGLKQKNSGDIQHWKRFEPQFLLLQINTVMSPKPEPMSAA